MYLSCLMIDVGENPDRPRPGRLWLRNLYRVHQRLSMAFPSSSRASEDPDFIKPFVPGDFASEQVHVPRGGNNGFLFRVDPLLGGRAMILVQSAIGPNWHYAFHNAGYLLAAMPNTRTFEPSFERGQRLRFRLVANPTRKIGTKTTPDGLKNNGQRVPVPTENLEDWLTTRAGAAGFTVERPVTIQAGHIYVFKNGVGSGNRFRSARYGGILEINDAERFRETLAGGIGPGKAFGFGLLSVAPMSGGLT